MRPESAGPQEASRAFDEAMKSVLTSLLDRHRSMERLRQAMPADDRTYLDLVERRLRDCEDALICWLRRYDEEIILNRGPRERE